MRFKKIYIEITNICNLNCSFCKGTKRANAFMSLEDFQDILVRIKGYTNSIYLHVLGEPLLHPQIKEMISLASKDYQVNITTNGYLLPRMKDVKGIRQVNISLQAIQNTEESFLTSLYESIESLRKNHTIVNLRVWVDVNPKIISFLESKYHVSLDSKKKIDDYLFIDYETPFIWPDIENKYYKETGSCQGTRNHIGILVDGTIIPCCLDAEGCINLGNIHNTSLEEVISSKRFTNMKENFENNKKVEELCKHCNFYDRIQTKKGGTL